MLKSPKSPKPSGAARLKNKGAATAEVGGAPLRRRIEDAVRQSILSGKFSPGDRLRERDLIEMLNVSRTSLREALRQIEAEGLVVIEPNRGPVVTIVTYEEVEELYEVRSVLEAQACSGFAERGSSTQMQAIREIFNFMTIAVQDDDVKKTLELKSKLYSIVLEGCGNRLIGHLLSQLHNRAMLLRRTSLSEPGRLQEMRHELSTLIDALAAHDAKAAWAISVHHISQAKRAALKVMRQNEMERGALKRGRGGAAKAVHPPVSQGGSRPVKNSKPGPSP